MMYIRSILTGQCYDEVITKAEYEAWKAKMGL